MTKIFIINAGQQFGHSGGGYNNEVTATTEAFFKGKNDFKVRVTHIDKGYDPAAEVEKFT